jgi:hypothetical protein
MTIAKKREKVDYEWQPEGKKGEDEEYDDEDLREEEMQILFNTI